MTNERSLYSSRSEAAQRVLAIFLSGIEWRADASVRQEPGYATSDALVHFEKSNVIYLGEAYSGDGYPRIDRSLGGTVEGMLKTLDPWTQQSGSRFV